MTTVSFSIMFGIMMTSIIMMLVLSLKCIPTVKAGKVDKFCLRYELFGSGKSEKIINKDRVLNTDGMVFLAVKGNSMSDYGIRNNCHVYVEPITTTKAKNNIVTRPVVVFSIDKGKKIQSLYKLRKFVAYVDNIVNVDWAALYDNLNNNNFKIKISKESFVQMLTDKVTRIEDKSGRFVLSETLNEESFVHEYSLHPVNSVFGKVRYVA